MRSLALLLIAALSAGTALAQADHTQPADAAPDTTVTVKAQVVLTDPPPPGVDVTGLDVANAVVQLEVLASRGMMPAADVWATMSDEQQLAHWAAVREKHDARRIVRGHADADGRIVFEDVPPGHYTLRVALFPGDAPAEIIRDNFSAGTRADLFHHFTVSEDETTLDLPTLELEPRNLLVVGEPVPDLTFDTLDGETASLSDYRGQWVLVDFWATWCAPCVAESPNVIAAANDFADQGLTLVTLSLDNEPDAPTAYLAEHNVPGTPGFLGPWRGDQTATAAFGITGIPFICLIDPDGNLAARDLRGERIAQAIQAALADDTPEPATDAADDADWVSIFNGTDLTGWRISETNADSVSVIDGALKTNGPAAHAYYAGPDGDFNATQFELRAQVYCDGPSNSGIYVLTTYQPQGWPGTGFECQVANGYGDPRKTGSVYGIQDLAESPVNDGEWFDYHITVRDGSITVRINGDVVNTWTQPDDWNDTNRSLNRPGTIALQAHDPGSTVRFRNLQLRVLD